MEDGIQNNIKSLSNRKIVIGLIILIIIFVAIGSISLYSFHKSNEKTIKYYHAVKEAKDIQSMYRDQANKWKIMILSRGNADVFPKNYYEFSKLSDRLQDSLFNLKMKFISEEYNIGEKIEQARLFNQKIYDKYVSLIFENLTKDLSSNLPFLMQEDEAKMLNDLEDVVASVTNLADKKTGNTANYYFLMMIASIVMVIALSIIIMIVIMKKRKSEE